MNLVINDICFAVVVVCFFIASVRIKFLERENDELKRKLKVRGDGE